jgi:GTP-binding protein
MAIKFANTHYAGLAANLEQVLSLQVPEVILSGRSNVGKSSLINALAGQKNLARVSQTPGKTRAIVYFLVDRAILLTDLPGFGFAAGPKSSRDHFRSLTDSYLNSGRPIALVLHLLDIRHPPAEQDLQMLTWLDTRRIPWQVVLAKADKLTREQIQKARAAFAEALMPGHAEDLIVFSAQSGLGLDELRRRIASCADTKSSHTE